MQTVFFSIIIIGLLISFHEAGHFFAAKKSGVLVEEFSLGMGPAVFSRQKGETLYSLRLLPLGGYVRMYGEEDNFSGANPERSFLAQPPLKKFFIAFSGPMMNFLLAFLLFSVVFVAFGTPYTPAVIGETVIDSPAAEAGILEGDRVVAVDGQDILRWTDMTGFIHYSGGKDVTLEIVRDGVVSEYTVVPEYNSEYDVYMIGIAPSDSIEWERTGFFAGIILAGRRTAEIFLLIIQGIVSIFAGSSGTEGLTGPVGVVKMIGDTAELGMVYLFNFTAVISVNLGILNLLPFPALDGGKIIFVLIEAVRGKAVNPEKENIIHLVGMVFLMALVIFITYKDIIRIFN